MPAFLLILLTDKRRKDDGVRSAEGKLNQVDSITPMSIIFSQNGKNAKRLERAPIQTEDYLQRYIHDNPESLPLQELKEGIRLLNIAREFPTNSGPIDLISIDQDADIYIVETKLYKNTDKRRVIAQILDYGAALWNCGATAFMDSLENAVISQFNMGLRAKLEEHYSMDSVAVDEYLNLLQQKASEGRFRFIVLMDQLDTRLKDLISFINSNSRFDIFGIELDFYQHQDFEIIIPNLYGAELKKSVESISSSTPRRKWNETEFFQQVAQQLSQEWSKKVHELYVWSMQYANEVTWGTGVQKASFNVKFSHVNPRSVLSVYSNGSITINFKSLVDPPYSVKYAQQLGEQLRQANLFNLPSDFLTKYPLIAVADWGNNLEQFLAILQAVLVSTP